MPFSLGERIKFLRKNHKLNQADFSRAIGISQGNLSLLEQNKFKPSIDTVLSIHKVFDTNLQWLLTGKVEQGEQPLVNLPNLTFSRKEIELIRLFRGLKEVDKTEIILIMALKCGLYKDPARE